MEQDTKRRFERISATENTLNWHVFEQVLLEYHSDLQGVSFQLVKAYDPDGIKLAGYPAMAIVKITNERARAFGNADVEILLDAMAFDELEEPTQAAIFDHELTHIEIEEDKYGDQQFDACERPKLKMRLHDHQHGWFDDVVARHGKASMESIQATRFYERHTADYVEGTVAPAPAQPKQVYASGAKPDRRRRRVE